MLKRILEPEVMDCPEEAREYDEMDHAAVNRQFVDDLLAGGEVRGDILDMGTGTALIPIELCERVEECRVMAIDLSTEMLDLARYRLEIAGMTHRIQLEHVDSKETPFADAMFDLIISNSIIHHIPDPSVVLREAVRVVKPGGRLFFRDLFRPDTEEQLRQLVETHVADQSPTQQKLFADSLRSALTVEEVQEIVTSLGFDPETVVQTSDRHWTWDAIRPE